MKKLNYSQDNQNNLCVICGKELPQLKIEQGKKTCSMSCAQRLAQNKPETKAKRSASLKKIEHLIQNRQSTKEKKSASMKKAWQKEENRVKWSNVQKEVQNRPEVSKKKSESSKAFYAIEENLETIRNMRHDPEIAERIRQTNISTWSKPEILQKHSDLMKIVQNKPGVNEKRSNSLKDYLSIPENKLKHNLATHSIEAQEKAIQTMIRNGTINSSSWEDEDYVKLCNCFGKENVLRQYFNKERYPFKCDFYIKSLDLFIECHYSYRHCYEPFDKDNPEHLQKLQWLKEKAENHRNPSNNNYWACIGVWTVSDVKKRQHAIDNNLNWLCFYYREDFNNWLSQTEKEGEAEEAKLQAEIDTCEG